MSATPTTEELPTEPIIPAAETPPAKPEPEKGSEDPLLAALLNEMGDGPPIKQVKVEDEPVKEEGKKPEEPAPASPPTPEVKAEIKPKVKKKVSFTPQPDAAPAAPAPVTLPAATPITVWPSEDPDKAYLDGLTEDQKEELEEAGWAEKNLNKSGAKKKLVDWYKKLDAEAERMAKEDPGVKFDASNEDWNKFLATKPGFSKSEQKRILTGTIREQAEAQIRKEQEPKMAAVERDAREAKLKPDVDNAVGQFREGLKQVVAEDVGDDGKETTVAAAAKLLATDPAKARAEYGLESAVIEQEQVKAVKLAETFTRFTRGLEQFDPENPGHAFLHQFVKARCDEMVKYGKPADKTRDGKRFVTKAEMYDLHLKVKAGTAPASEMNEVWTYSHRDILEMLAQNAKYVIRERISEEEERAKANGFERRARASAETPKVEAEVKPLNPPKSMSTPSKGAAAIPAAKAAIPSDGIDITTTLGMN